MRYRLILTALLYTISLNTFAQVALETSRAVTGGGGSLFMFSNNTLTNTKKVSYENISGSPFWNNDYLIARLYDNEGHLLGKAPVKINLYTNEVYYVVPSGEEKVAEAGKVNKIVFLGPDSAKPLAVFENNVAGVAEVNPHAEGSFYVEIMNQGDLQLLKQTQVLFNSGDSLMGTTKRYYFLKEIQYYVSNQAGEVIRLKKMNKDNVLKALKLNAEHEKWIKENDINMKKEEDVIKFLNYINTQKPENKTSSAS